RTGADRGDGAVRPARGVRRTRAAQGPPQGSAGRGRSGAVRRRRRHPATATAAKPRGRTDTAGTRPHSRPQQREAPGLTAPRVGGTPYLRLFVCTAARSDGGQCPPYSTDRAPPTGARWRAMLLLLRFPIPCSRLESIARKRAPTWMLFAD